ncbi:MAG: hypothetical protein KGJ66_02150 [Alphaproteobacteria bacterium]|nr:hypothetical protein [Alphaproteobacteria bacterium]
MTGRGQIFRRALAGVLAGALGVAMPLAAFAQTCPPGYYYASDGNCYPGPPPTYPAPAYDATPPVAPPPVVMDGFLLGLGILIGGLAASEHHGGDRGRPEEHGPPRGYSPPPGHRPGSYEHH